MRTFSEENKTREIVSTGRSETFNTIDFKEYTASDAFYRSIEELFYTGSAVEYIPEQVRNQSASYTHYQIPYNKRSGGLYANTFVLESGSLKLVDDGNGNLTDANDPLEPHVGNIFYNSGNIMITSEGTFHNSSTKYKEIKNLNVTLSYKRETFFVHNKYFIDVNADDYTFSMNPTFRDSKAPHPFLTTIYLYNEKNEKIAVAKLSKPVSTENDVFIILDDLETI